MFATNHRVPRAVAALAAASLVDTAAAKTPQVWVKNNIRPSSQNRPDCKLSGNPTFDVNVFYGNAQKKVQPGETQGPVVADLFIGIQVDGWFWSYTDGNQLASRVGNDATLGRGNKNPDNSGGQIYLNTNCSFQKLERPTYYGWGVPTFGIANIKSEKYNGGCLLTISDNDDTYRLSTLKGVTYPGMSNGTPATAEMLDQVAAGCKVESYPKSWGSIKLSGEDAFDTSKMNIAKATTTCKEGGNTPTKAPNSPTTKSPATKSPATKSPATKSPATKSPATKSPATKGPTTKAPKTQAPATTPSPTTDPSDESCGPSDDSYARMLSAAGHPLREEEPLVLL